MTHRVAVSPARAVLDVALLYAALDAIRAHLGLSWRAVGRILDIPDATFTRMSQGGMVSVLALVKILAWARLPLERFVREERV